MSDAGSAAQAAPPKNIAEKTLKRDDYTCRFCGFRSQKFQRVIPYIQAETPPFATSCTFCEQCLFLERAGITGAGLLIWLPEIPQAQLNHIVRAAYVARSVANDEPIGVLATRTIDALTSRRAEAKKRLGSDDPMLLATLLHESMNDDERKAAVQKLDGIRLLPSEKHLMRGHSGDVNQFPAMVHYWISPEGPYATLPTDAWSDMFKTATKTSGHA